VGRSCSERRLPPSFQKVLHLGWTIVCVSAEFHHVLGVEQGAVACEHKEVRDSKDGSIGGQGVIVFVLRARVNRHRDEVSVAKLPQVGVLLEERF